MRINPLTVLARSLYLQVLTAIALGAVIGHFFPHFASELKPLGDGFIRLIRMLIAPIIFCTVVTGIAHMGDLRKVGRVGLKALIYFEITTTLALIIGLSIANFFQPGATMNADVSKLDPQALAQATHGAKPATAAEFILNIIPTDVVDAFARGDVIQVLLFSVLLGLALSMTGHRGKPLLGVIESFSEALFKIIGMVMRLAPIGAFGAMAFTVGRYGIGSLASLGKLMFAFYTTCALFILIVLGIILRYSRVNIFKFLAYIREEILIVLGTSSSESVLPRIMEKLEKLGCNHSVVGLVIPAGYSFNLDGTCIYLTLASLFVAQATHTPVNLGQQLAILGFLLLSSKGAAGVTGSGFITLAATLSSTSTIPVAGLVLILGVDRFMSEARAITNLIGNSVATVTIANWEKELDREKLRAVMSS